MAKVKSKAKTAAVPISDVAPPNASAPSPSSKSIIIPSRPLMRDPMMTPPAETAPEAPQESAQTSAPAVVQTAPVALTMSHERVILPPSSSTTKPATVIPMTDVTPPPTAESNKDVETEPKASSAAVAEPMNLEAVEAKQEDIEDERRAAIDALVTSEKYFLPVDGVELKKARYTAFFGILLIIVLAVAWADAAIDAGLVPAHNVPHTHFFASSNSNTTPSPSAAPTPTAFKNTTTPQGKVQFRYPSSWSSKDLSSDQTGDSFKVQPTRVDLITTVNAQIIYYTNKVSPPSPTTETTRVTVLDVSYQPFAISKSATAYVRDLVYKDAKGTIGVNSSVTGDQLVKISDILDGPTSDYQTALKPQKYSFSLDAKRTVGNVEGYGTLTAAQKELKNPIFQQGRKILLSIRLAAQ